MSTNRKIIIAGNWKMNTDLNSAVELAVNVAKSVTKESILADREVVIAPPYPFLQAIYLALVDLFEDGKLSIRLASQDVSAYGDGAYTGDVSIGMLGSLPGVTDVIVGHSERRKHHSESDEIIAKKILNVLIDSEMRVLFCLGESLDERESGKAEEIVEKQIYLGLQEVNREHLINESTSTGGLRVVVCYEPIWAIGTGRAASTQDAESMHAHIRRVLEEKYDVDLAGQI